MSWNQHSKFLLIPLNHKWITFLPKIRAKDATYSSSCFGIAKFGSGEGWNYFREVIPLTHSDIPWWTKEICKDACICVESKWVKSRVVRLGHPCVHSSLNETQLITSKTCVLHIALVYMTENLGTRNLTLFLAISLCILTPRVEIDCRLFHLCFWSCLSVGEEFTSFNFIPKVICRMFLEAICCCGQLWVWHMFCGKGLWWVMPPNEIHRSHWNTNGVSIDRMDLCQAHCKQVPECGKDLWNQ